MTFVFPNIISVHGPRFAIDMVRFFARAVQYGFRIVRKIVLGKGLCSIKCLIGNINGCAIGVMKIFDLVAMDGVMTPVVDFAPVVDRLSKKCKIKVFMHDNLSGRVR